MHRVLPLPWLFDIALVGRSTQSRCFGLVGLARHVEIKFMSSPGRGRGPYSHIFSMVMSMRFQISKRAEDSL